MEENEYPPQVRIKTENGKAYYPTFEKNTQGNWEMKRQGISQDVTTPYRLRKANQIEGQGLIHDTNGYDHPDFKEMQELASSHGFDLIPF